MFKASNQPGLFTFENQLLNNEQQQPLEKTPEKAFYNIVFTNKGKRLQSLVFRKWQSPKRAGKCVSFSPDTERAKIMELR
jgi:hypothetical protein